MQLSVQDVDPAGAAWIAGRDGLDAKLEMAAAARALRLPLTLNVVLHRGNIARTADFVALAERIGAERLELANTQYLGWALLNRDALLPSRAELAAARAVADAARERLRGRIEILFVRPDYYADRPRACMDGWARRYIVVTPDGTALPCHQAGSIPSLAFESVRDRSLAALWSDSPAFRAFRGEAWMPEPCRTCDERDIDFGGCRCQAMALLGDAAAPDPACARTPRHDLVLAARVRADDPAEPDRGAAAPAPFHRRAEPIRSARCVRGRRPDGRPCQSMSRLEPWVGSALEPKLHHGRAAQDLRTASDRAALVRRMDGARVLSRRRVGAQGAVRDRHPAAQRNRLAAHGSRARRHD